VGTEVDLIGDVAFRTSVRLSSFFIGVWFKADTADLPQSTLSLVHEFSRWADYVLNG
jgi:hypothetical protein